MQRRLLFKSLVAAGLASLASRAARAQEARAQKVVYHIADADKVPFAFANMRNHRVGGTAGIQLAAVVHGPALAVLRASAGPDAIGREFSARLDAGDQFFACANTLAAHGWTLADLLPGFGLADKGGVVKLADMQAQGWIYLRP